MKRGLLVVLFLLLGSGLAQASLPMEHWQFNKTVTAPGEGVTLVQLDNEILGHTRDDLGDLRVTDEQGQEIPYQVMPVALLGEELYEKVGLINNVVQEQQFSAVTFAFEETQLSNRITLDIETKGDFLREVIIEGSSDNEAWSIIKKDKIFVVGPDITDTELLYPDASFRYIRVTIDAKGQKALSIQGGRIGYQPVDSRILATLPGKITEMKQEQELTSVVIELPVKGFYLNEIKLSIADRNYHRTVAVYHSNDKQTWRNIGNRSIYHYQWSGYQATQPTLTIGQMTGRYIKLDIDNQDSPPLHIDNSEILGEVPKILVDLPAGTSRIWYGNVQAESPNYDLGRFAHLINPQELKILIPGLEETNKNYQPPRKPWTEENKWLLNGVIILLALVLGGYISKMMRKA